MSDNLSPFNRHVATSLDALFWEFFKAGYH